jgi:hypothetical protein
LKETYAAENKEAHLVFQPLTYGVRRRLGLLGGSEALEQRPHAVLENLPPDPEKGRLFPAAHRGVRGRLRVAAVIPRLPGPQETHDLGTGPEPEEQGDKNADVARGVSPGRWDSKWRLGGRLTA